MVNSVFTKKSSLSKMWLISIALVTVTAVAGLASANPIFSQTITNPSVSDGASASDRDPSWLRGSQMADELTLASSATARSVTWWGIFGFKNTPVTPVSFDLIFYGDAGGLPDGNNVISSTPVSFTSLTDTGSDLNGEDIYEFQANLIPTAIPGGTKIWFSVLADTSNDPDDSFLWRVDMVGSAAGRIGLTEPFSPSVNQAALFVLDDAPLPEPSSMALLGLGTLLIARRRRNG